MIIVCPACGRRYRIDRSSLSAGRRLRCTGCRQVFDARPLAPPAAGQQTNRLTMPPSAPPAREPAQGGSAPAVGGHALVLIGDVNRPFRATAQKILESLGCQVETSELGEVVFRATVNRRPVLLLLNTRLPGLSGIAVCEGVKGSPHLKGIKVVLVSSTVQPPETGQATRPGFEPDDWIEDTIGVQDLRDCLAALLGRSHGDAPRRSSQPAARPAAPGIPVGADPPSPQAALSPVPSAEPSPPAIEPEAFRPAPTKKIDPRDVLDPQAEIQRLARIMLSDLKLYNPDRFATAVHDGRLLETFRSELLRGKDLITSRFPDLPDRIALLTAALRQGIEDEQGAARAE